MKGAKQKKAVKLKSSESHYFYNVIRNTTKPKLKLKKYDPVKRKHVIFNETK